MGRIILEGFMGSGKSTYGRRLSEILNVEFIDTDEAIERHEERSISEIFADDGEEAFRDMESEFISHLAQSRLHRNSIVSVGGGLPVREENRRYMKKAGKVIYLRAKGDTLKDRLRGRAAGRPMLDGDIDRKVDELLNFRESMYMDAADIVVDVDEREIDDVLSELLTYWPKPQRGIRT